MFSNTSLLFIIMDITLFSPIMYHFFQLYLTQSGLYKTVRRVLDIDRWYFMGTAGVPRMQVLRKKIAAWSSVVLGQLCLGHRNCFPAHQYLNLTTFGSYSHTGTSKTQSC